MQAITTERVLLVDDEPQVLVALEDLLSDRFIVLKADSGENALDLLEHEHDIAVVITDQRMPKMTGDELLARLGEYSNALRILVTGYADPSAVIRAVNDGQVFAYVAKPWNDEDLLLKVGRAAEHFRLAQELAHERRLLHDLMDSIPDGIYFKDRDLRFLRANRPIAALLGVADPEELVGKTLREVLAQAGVAEAAELEEQRLLLEAKPLRDVVREFRATTSTAWFSETKAPIRSETGDVLGLVGISRDVTERITTETTSLPFEVR